MLLLTKHQFLTLLKALAAEWALILTATLLTTSGKPFQKSGAYCNGKRGFNLEWDVRQAHVGCMVRDAPTLKRKHLIFWPNKKINNIYIRLHVLLRTVSIVCHCEIWCISFQFYVPNSSGRRTGLVRPFTWRWQRRERAGRRPSLTTPPAPSGTIASLCKLMFRHLHSSHGFFVYTEQKRHSCVSRDLLGEKDETVPRLNHHFRPILQPRFISTLVLFFPWVKNPLDDFQYGGKKYLLVHLWTTHVFRFIF